MRPEIIAACEAIHRASKILLSHYDKIGNVRNKRTGTDQHLTGNSLRASEYDPVTIADEEADTCLREYLTKAYPSYGWLSEETVDSPDRLEKKLIWIVDPIDGTKEFIDQIGEFVISIALVEDGVPIIAVIYNPVTEELFRAVRNGGCFLNNKRVFCTEPMRLGQAKVMVSRSESARGEVEPLQMHVAKLIPVGSIAYKLALVAAGAADLTASLQPKNEWDVCAGELLIREAGGEMLDLNGRERHYNQPNTRIEPGLVAGNNDLTSQALNLISKINNPSD